MPFSCQPAAGTASMACGAGLNDLRDMGLIDRLPRMVGCQTEATHPLLHALTHDSREIEVQPEPEVS